MSERDFDLDAYLARIGLPDAGAPSLALLRALIAHHTATIPFENLDIVLGRPIAMDIGSIQAKLVDANRGGYCLEHNTLLRAALERLGFSVTSLMARVVRGAAADAITQRTHMMLRVVLPDGVFLADAGFGNMTPTAPLMMREHGAQATEHEDYRLLPADGETLLQVRLATQWENAYRFSGQPSHPIDHEVANWFTSTRPDGRFTANVIAARPRSKCRKTLLNGVVTIRGTDDRMERFVIETAEVLRDSLHDHFGIDLDAGESTTLYAAMRHFSERPQAPFRLD